jgi:hypothetical protein
MGWWKYWSFKIFKKIKTNCFYDPRAKTVMLTVFGFVFCLNENWIIIIIII